MNARREQLNAAQKTWRAGQRAIGRVSVSVWVQPELRALVRNYSARITEQQEAENKKALRLAARVVS